jgi:hypothetical protein
MKTNRKQWFLDRIGKRVYRTNFECCDHCEKVYQEGIVIIDRIHAYYLQACQRELGIKYFDTIKERNDYENKSR